MALTYILPSGDTLLPKDSKIKILYLQIHLLKDKENHFCIHIAVIASFILWKKKKGFSTGLITPLKIHLVPQK